MKILNLVFKNINSLAGVWKIDFTDPDFNSGLFILHGATGAGKTSILDALCLALYGKTSRQTSFNKMQNEVMTKGTGSCFAQADFETGGIQYRSYWEHKRSKSGLDFQTGCTRRFYQLGKNETVLAEKISDVNDKIISIVGMDFEQFTSAVLLPQGKFDAFLTAEKKQRSEILEKISRTQIYSMIGAAIHRRRSDEDGKLDVLKYKTAEIPVMSEFAESELLEKIKSDYASVEEKKVWLNIIDLQLKQYDEYDKIQKEIFILNKKIDGLQQEVVLEKERFANLERAKKAGSIANIILQFDQTKYEKEKLEVEIKKITLDIDTAGKKHSGLLPAKNAAARENEEALKELSENEPRIKRARELDVRIQETKNHISYRRVKIQELKQTSDKLSADFMMNAERAKDLQNRIDGLKNKIGALKEETGENRVRMESIGESMASLSVFSSTVSFAENRGSLRDGEPCPLCGSHEHPFCDNETELHEKQEQLKKLQLENSKLKRAVADAEKSLEKLEIEKSQAETGLSGLETGQAAAQATRESAESQIETLQNESMDYEKQSAILKEERAAIVVADDIDQFEQALKRRAAVSTENLGRIDKQLSDYKRDEENYTRLLIEKEEQNKFLQQIFEQKQSLMENAFAEHGFDSYDAWKSFNWTTEEITRIERAKIYLSTELNNAEEQKTRFMDDLKKLPPLPDNQYRNIKNEKEMISSSVEEINKEIGGLEKQIEINNNNKLRKSDIIEKINAQKEICGRWKWMDDWIGGVDGWKFKNYVQALTLKFLIQNANDYLLSMSGQRYIMNCRQDNDELLPLIIDRYQGSIERSITNLSGGERFMLSLSLALGLSKLNSSKLSIDSFFLDEGFGTLDKESLELTINILNGLKQYQGKLTGIISHVEELHEHIAASIEVVKTGGGRSRLSGCGVSKA